MGLYMLSNLDQILPAPAEFLFAFQQNSSLTNVDVGPMLKQSLNKVLEVYYPLAGRMKVGFDGKLVVDCDSADGGVPFAETFSEEEMVGDISMIDQKLASKLVHSNHTPFQTILDVPPLAIQVNRFRCGGMILGVRMNHCIFDGVALADFMQFWSEIAVGLPISIKPHLDRSILSPRKPPRIQFPDPEYTKLETPHIPLTYKKLATKSFCFTPTMLSQLRNIAMQKEAASTPPTSFELISALAWKCGTMAKMVSSNETSQIVVAVDSRNRLQPPMPERYFGNGVVLSCARSRAGELTRQPLAYAVGMVQDSIRAVTEEHIRLSIDFLEVSRKSMELDNTFFMTKWSRLPFYEIDFGWGAATQVAPAAALKDSMVLFLQGNHKKNLVLRVTLPVQQMELFQELITSEFNQD